MVTILVAHLDDLVLREELLKNNNFNNIYSWYISFSVYSWLGCIADAFEIMPINL